MSAIAQPLTLPRADARGPLPLPAGARENNVTSPLGGEVGARHRVRGQSKDA
jgi:hypothetical protein